MTNPRGNSRPARALTKKALGTRAALLDAAREVFIEQGYSGASVAEIVRRCGVSQGTFYLYFHGKEEVLLELTDRIVDRYVEMAAAIPKKSGDPWSRLSKSVALLYEHTASNYQFHRVLGDLDLMDPVTISYYDSAARFLRSEVRQLASEGHIRPLDPNLVAYAIIGMIHFQFQDWGAELERCPAHRLEDLTLRLLREGITGEKPFTPAEINRGLTQMESPVSPDRPSERLSQRQRTRKDLFEAAERIFGQRGYNYASVADITRLAGVAQGTFYVHFKSKSDLLVGVIQYLNRELRRALSLAIKGCQDRRNAERAGMFAFFRFIAMHRELYRIVAECESVNTDAAMLYYIRLAQGYQQGLKIGFSQGEIREMHRSFLVRALMGFSHMIGLKWLIWNSSPRAEVPAQLVEEAADMMLFGLEPR